MQMHQSLKCAGLASLAAVFLAGNLKAEELPSVKAMLANAAQNAAAMKAPEVFAGRPAAASKSSDATVAAQLKDAMGTMNDVAKTLSGINWTVTSQDDLVQFSVDTAICTVQLTSSDSSKKPSPIGALRYASYVLSTSRPDQNELSAELVKDAQGLQDLSDGIEAAVRTRNLDGSKLTAAGLSILAKSSNDAAAALKVLGD